MIHKLPQIPDMKISDCFSRSPSFIAVVCVQVRTCSLLFTMGADYSIQSGVSGIWRDSKRSSRNVSDLNVPDAQLIGGTDGKLSHTVTFPNLSWDWHIRLRTWHSSNTTLAGCPLFVCVRCALTCVCAQAWKDFTTGLKWPATCWKLLLLLSGDRRWWCAFLH